MSTTTAERRCEARVTVEPNEHERLVNGERHPLMRVVLDDVYVSMRTADARKLAWRIEEIAEHLDRGYFATRTITICVPADHVNALRELFDSQADTFLDMAGDSGTDDEYERYLHLADVARAAHDKLGEAPIGGPALLRGPRGPLAYLIDNYLTDEDNDMRVRMDAARAARAAMNGETEDAA